METLFLTILHVSSEIHTFFLAYWAFGLGMALRKAAKSTSSLVGVARGWRGSLMLRQRYLVCSLKGELQRHPRTN